MGKLFGGSPFQPLQEHMDKAMECMEFLPALLDAFMENDRGKIHELKEKISRLEHEADEIKNTIRDNIPRKFFSPVHRSDYIAFLKVQDRFPDTVEDIGVLLSLRNTRCPEFVKPPLKQFLEKTIESFTQAREIVDQLSDLAASSFSGPDVEKTLNMITKVGHLEWEADNLQTELARVIFKHEDEVDVLSIIFLNELTKKLGSLSNHAESIGDRMRVLLAS